MDRFALYELCVQTPAQDVRLLRAIHMGAPRRLGEDFCGTAALARAWIRMVRDGRAVAVDRDVEPLRRVRPHPRLQTIQSDVRATSARVDLLCALNFSLCEWHERAQLVDYLRHARSRLLPRGIFVADVYGGEGAFATGRLRERRTTRDGRRVTYEFEQRSADALTSRVVDVLHFTVEHPRERLRDAFVYDWRLWSVPELVDAMRDAGFAATQIYSRFEHAVDGRGRTHVQPVTSARELGAAFCVLVVGRR